PEMNYDKGDPMPYAEAAKQLTTQLLEDAKSVQLLFDKGPETDKYDRLLAYVFVDGVSLHEILLNEGLAAVRYVNKPNNSLEDDLRKIQQQAEAKKLNIWAHPNYLQKDGFHPEEVGK
ncbi:MAG: thermonuclease family protein, partial [Solibacillus sp.]